MIRAALFVADYRDADVLMAAAGLAAPDMSTNATMPQHEFGAALRNASAALLHSITRGVWTDEAAVSANLAERCVSAILPGIWPRLPAILAGGTERIDFSLPVLWAERWMASKIAAHGSVPAKLWNALGKLHGVCDSRLNQLRQLAAGVPTIDDLPDLNRPCADVLAALASWRAGLLFLPCFDEPQEQRTGTAPAPAPAAMVAEDAA